MGNYSLLSLSNSSEPSHGPSEGYVEGTELSFKYGVPIGWVALFTPGDFVSKSEYLPLDDCYVDRLFLMTSVGIANSTLNDREANLSNAFGEKWNSSVNLFRQYLNNPQATYVQIDLSEYMEMVGGPQHTQQGLTEWIETVSLPYHTDKKRLISREPKVHRAWRQLKAELPSEKKHPEDYTNYLFGWRDEIERACPT